MREMLFAALLLAAALLFASPAAAAPYDSMTIDASHTYLRLGFNDTVAVNVTLMERGESSGTANVPIIVTLKTGASYAAFDNSLIITDGTGRGSAILRLKPDSQPERFRLPLMLWIQASVIGNDGVVNSTGVYITSSGPIWGYVVDDVGGTITGASITVTAPDGKAFPGSPFVSSDGSGSPMGYYRIDNLPVELYGRYTLAATKNGYTGAKLAEAGYENIRNDIVISGYRDTVDVPSIVTGNTNATLTPTPLPVNATETPARPTTMTTTIIIAIALITLVYIGLKAYRRMF